MERLAHREVIKHSDLDSFEKAIRAVVLAARGEYPNWAGRSLTLVENADGLTIHALELIETTMSDKSKALSIRLIFVGDVGLG